MLSLIATTTVQVCLLILSHTQMHIDIASLSFEHDILHYNCFFPEKDTVGCFGILISAIKLKKKNLLILTRGCFFHRFFFLREGGRR